MAFFVCDYFVTVIKSCQWLFFFVIAFVIYFISSSSVVTHPSSYVACLGDMLGDGSSGAQIWKLKNTALKKIKNKSMVGNWPAQTGSLSLDKAVWCSIASNSRKFLFHSQGQLQMLLNIHFIQNVTFMFTTNWICCRFLTYSSDADEDNYTRQTVWTVG